MPNYFQTATTVYNNFSLKLRESIPQPKDPNRAILFKVMTQGKEIISTDQEAGVPDMKVRRRPQQNVPRLESIFDAGQNDGQGDYINLGYFKGAIRPGDEPENIWFDRDQDGIYCVPARERTKYEVLMLSNFNASCCNPSHQAPEGGYIFEMVKPEKTEAERYERRLAIGTANDYIHDADISTLKRLAPKLKIAIPAHDDEEGAALRNAFMDEAEKNPESVINQFSADDDKLYKLVDEAVKYEVVNFDSEKAAWVLTHNQAYLTAVLPGNKHENALVDFLIGYPATEKAITQAVASKKKK